MTDPATLLSIGELATRTGLPVRTIRFYSDEGLLPPADRTVRRLPPLRRGTRSPGSSCCGRSVSSGLGLRRRPRRWLEREVERRGPRAARTWTLLDAQIRVLRLRRAVLRAVAQREATPSWMRCRLMNRPRARCPMTERKRLDRRVLGPRSSAGLDIDPGFAARHAVRAAGAPGRPDPAAGRRLDRAGGARRRTRTSARTIRQHERDACRPPAHAGEPDGPDRRRSCAALVAEWASAAVAAVDRADTRRRLRRGQALAATFAVADDDPADPASGGARLADRLASGTDARAERYWQLLATINGWPPVTATVPAWEWFVAALRAER